MYEDPRDYRELDEWSDTDNADQYWAPFPVEVGDDYVPDCCVSMLAIDEAVVVVDSCWGDTQAWRVRNGPEFHCDPDSDRMLYRSCRIISTLDTSVRETGVTVCLADISVDSDFCPSVKLLVPQGCQDRTVLNDYCAPVLRKGLRESRVLPSISADAACGMVSGILASVAGVMLSEGEVRIDIIKLNKIHRRPGFEGWAIVCWPCLTLLNMMLKTDWDPGGRSAQTKTMGRISLAIFGFYGWLNGI